MMIAEVVEAEVAVDPSPDSSIPFRSKADLPAPTYFSARHSEAENEPVFEISIETIRISGRILG